MSKASVKPASALHELLAWSNARPEWLRDALRRIVVKGGVDDADIKELERICRAKHKADTSYLPDVLGCLGMRVWCREPESNRHAVASAGF